MFTRKGDTGETDSGAGERLSKASLEVEVEGMIDETSTLIGLALVRSQWDDFRSSLTKAQDLVFNMGEHILTAGKGRVVTESDVDWLESLTKKYRDEVGRIELFVEPGGSEASVALHMARVSARKLERGVVSLNRGKKIDPTVMKFANRLSSLLFMMALSANKRLGQKERIWELRKPSS